MIQRRRDPPNRKGRVVVLSDLQGEQKERFYQFLVSNDVEFVMRNDGNYMAHVRVVPPTTGPGSDAPRARTTEEGTVERERGSTKEDLFQRPATSDMKISREPSQLDPRSSKPNPAQTARLTQTFSQRYEAFCESLQAIEYMPRPRPIIQVTRLLDEIYDARFARDTTRIRMESNGEIFELERQDERFPSFVLQYFTRLYGLRRMVNQTAWGLVVSIDRWRKSSPAISLFALFFEESLSTKELLFFLFARSIVEKELNIDPHQRSYKKQWWLTAEQQATCLNAIFATRTQLIDRVTHVLTSANVSMSFFLLTMTMEYHRTRTGTELPTVQDEQGTKTDKDVQGVMTRLYEVVGPNAPVDTSQIVGWAESLVQHKQELDKMAESWDHLRPRDEGPGQHVDTSPIRLDPVERELQRMEMENPQDRPNLDKDVDAKDLEQMKMMPAESFRSHLEPNIRTMLRLKVNITVKTLGPQMPKAVVLEVSRNFAAIVDALVNATVTQRQDLWLKELQPVEIKDSAFLKKAETAEAGDKNQNFLMIQDRLNFYVAKQTTAAQVDAFLNEILVLPEVIARAKQLLKETTEKYQELAKIHQLYMGSVRVRQYGT